MDGEDDFDGGDSGGDTGSYEPAEVNETRRVISHWPPPALSAATSIESFAVSTKRETAPRFSNIASRSNSNLASRTAAGCEIQLAQPRVLEII
jgi:hypothetical protein